MSDLGSRSRHRFVTLQVLYSLMPSLRSRCRSRAQGHSVFASLQSASCRALTGLVLLICAFLLCGYVVPSRKVLQRAIGSTPRYPLHAAKLLPVRFNGVEGTLYLGDRGDFALSVEERVFLSSPPGVAPDDRLSALWLALEFITAPSVEDLLSQLMVAGVDLGRSGYARAACSSDGVAMTVGSRGEGEPQWPQLWFARDSARLCRVSLPSGGALTVGAADGVGLPQWMQWDGGDRLEVVGVPQECPLPPVWAQSNAPLEVPAPAESAGDWRRAFGGPQP